MICITNPHDFIMAKAKRQAAPRRDSKEPSLIQNNLVIDVETILAECDAEDGDKLTLRQKIWCLEYCRTFNQKKACITAGYNPEYGPFVLANDNVKAFCKKFLAKHGLEAEFCVGMLNQIIRFDASNFLSEDGLIDIDKVRSAGYGHLIEAISVGKDGVKLKMVSKTEGLKVALNVLGKLNPKDTAVNDILLEQQQRLAEKEAELQQRELVLIQKESKQDG